MVYKDSAGKEISLSIKKVYINNESKQLWKHLKKE